MKIRALPLSALSLVLCAISLSSCGEVGSGEKAEAAKLAVEVATVESGIMESTLSLQGQIDPQEQADLYARVPGFIERVLVDRGSHVRKGDVLVRLNAPELLAQRSGASADLGQAQARFVAAQARYAADSSTAERLANAARTPGVVADNDVNIARQNAASSRAQMNAAQQAVAAARDSLRGSAQMGDYLTIRAPFDGVITQRNLHTGALVGPNAGAQPILKIASTGPLRLTLQVPAEAATAVSAGQEVSFTLPSDPGRTFKAPVARKADAIDPRSRTMTVELKVDGTAFPGGFASVKWPFRRAAPTAQVPTTAVGNDQQRQFVIVIDKGKVRWVDVTTGMTRDGKVEMFGDVRSGQTVALRATDALAEGTDVQPVKPKPTTAAK